MTSANRGWWAEGWGRRWPVKCASRRSRSVKPVWWVNRARWWCRGAAIWANWCRLWHPSLVWRYCRIPTRLSACGRRWVSRRDAESWGWCRADRRWRHSVCCHPGAMRWIRVRRRPRDCGSRVCLTPRRHEARCWVLYPNRSLWDRLSA